jgi:hypothetical protein
MVLMKKVFSVFLLFFYSLTTFVPPAFAQTPTLGYFTRPTWPTPFNYPCHQTTGTDPEFHPLRPYPGNPCDPLIPRKDPWASEDPKFRFLTPKCGKSLNVEGNVTKQDVVDICNLANLPNPLPADLDSLLDRNYDGSPDGNNESPYYICPPNGTYCTPNQIYFLKRITWNVNVDLSSAQLPIMGNTELTMADSAKTNNYLNWYLNGTIYQSEQLPLNNYKPNDRTRIVNSSGPLNKLLPKDIRDGIKSAIANGAEDEGYGFVYHNYLVACQKNVDDEYVFRFLRDLLKAEVGGLIDWLRVVRTLTIGGWRQLPRVGVAILRAIFETPNELTGVHLQITLIDAGLDAFAGSGPLAALNELVKLGNHTLTRIAILIQDLRTDMAESCQTSSTRKRLQDL